MSRNKIEGKFAGKIEGSYFRTRANNRVNVPCQYRAFRAACSKNIRRVI